jgi:hypothetical protein
VVAAVGFSCLGCPLRFRRLATCTTTALTHMLSHFTSVLNYEFDTVIRDRCNRKNRSQGKGAKACGDKIVNFGKMAERNEVVFK